jgi:hypothetical protein
MEMDWHIQTRINRSLIIDHVLSRRKNVLNDFRDHAKEVFESLMNQLQEVEKFIAIGWRPKINGSWLELYPRHLSQDVGLEEVRALAPSYALLGSHQKAIL